MGKSNKPKKTTEAERVKSLYLRIAALKLEACELSLTPIPECQEAEAATLEAHLSTRKVSNHGQNYFTD
jgi:hypothetical protein